MDYGTVVIAAVAFCTYWPLKYAVRGLMQFIFPQGLPGEPNTALLASIKSNPTAATSAKDLENVTEYDYIIIGTGTAGCVLANRLSTDPNTKVLAIEAGHSDMKQLMSRIPAGLTKLFKTSADWAFETTPQPNCDDRQLQWPRGKMIGGCSSINGMIYTRGAPDDYDEWARLGNKGWAYKDVVSYMKKAERFQQPKGSERRLSPEDMAQHGLKGPWNIGYSAWSKIAKVFPDACDAVGIKKVTDINTDRGMIGAAPLQTFIDEFGQRSSTAVAYLTADVVERPNLKIASGQNVTRIIFDTTGTKPRAVGVEMSASKSSLVRYLAKAKKEVLLCAGAVGTPQLLKISGVGSERELHEFDIPLVKNLPGVGENLMDHAAYHGVTLKTDKNVSFHYLQDPIQNIPAVWEWLRHGTGDMTSQATETAAFIRTVDQKDVPGSLKNRDLSSGPTSADLELMTFSVCFTNHGSFIAPMKDGYVSISSICLRPESRGTIRLASSDVFIPPVIDPKALSADYDLEILLYGAKLAIKVARSEPYKKYFKGWYIGPHHPIDWDTATDEQIKEEIQKKLETLYHPMGTAKMGVGSDAVVDDQLKVHGIDGLRIVDASIFPTPVACHPCAPVVMVAEKAADLILQS